MCRRRGQSWLELALWWVVAKPHTTAPAKSWVQPAILQMNKLRPVQAHCPVGKPRGHSAFSRLWQWSPPHAVHQTEESKDVLRNWYLRSVFSKLFLIVPYWAWDGGGWGCFCLYLFIVLDQTSKAKWTANSKKLWLLGPTHHHWLPKILLLGYGCLWQRELLFTGRNAKNVYSDDSLRMRAGP